MNNKEFGKQLEKRTKLFAIEVIRLSALIPKSIESTAIRNQITKSGTSIGANYREANRSRSKADFRNKIKICEGEINETIYWLEIIMDQKWASPENASQLLKEANELLAIFTSIVNKLKL